MSQTPDFADAFDSIAKAAELARKVRGRDQERPTTPIEVTAVSSRGRVSITMVDGKARSVRLDEMWLADAELAEIEDAVRDTMNEAWQESSAQALAALRNVTPDMAEVSDAVDAARKELHGAYRSALGEIRGM